MWHTRGKSIFHESNTFGPEAGLGSEFVPLKKEVKLEVLPCCTKFHEPHVVLEYAHFPNIIIAMKALPYDTRLINI